MTKLMLMTAAAAAAIGVQAAYDWQKPHAKVLSDGDLAYAPEAWKEPKPSDARYIDFAGGDDTRDGRSPATAWKHHPNDPAADGRAKGAQAATYVFKRGVTYRGKLTGRLANATLTVPLEKEKFVRHVSTASAESKRSVAPPVSLMPIAPAE